MMAAETEIERLVVRLVGDAQQYLGMLKKAEAASAQTADKVGQSAKAIEGFQAKLETVGNKMMSAGRAMSLAVTTSFGAISAAATYEATQFEGALSRMVGLVGVAEDQVAVYREEILSLAPQVGKSPIELAKAMEFITGSGIRGAAAMETLVASAKSGAAGLGETVSIANAATSAMNAYGSANLSAAQAVDVLVAAVREGKAEASSFAPVFGQLLPLTSELKMEFGEVGGILAFLTRTTGDASIAATQLRSMLTQLNRKEFSTRLEKLGFSADALVERVGKVGLVRALQEFKAASEAAGVPLKDLITDTEGLMGALQLTGPQAQIAADMVASVSDSVGDAEAAFQAYTKTSGYKFAQAVSQAKIALIELGDILMPITQAMNRMSMGMRDAWMILPSSVKTVVASVGVFVMALGPLLVSVGWVITSLRVWKAAIIATSTTIYSTIIPAIGAYIKATYAKIVAINASRVAMLAAKGAAVGLALYGIYAISKAIYETNPWVLKLNESLSNFDVIATNLSGREMSKNIKFNMAVEQEQDAGKKREMLQNELDLSKKQLEGINNQAKIAQNNLNDLAPTWLSLKQAGKSVWEAEKKNFDDANKRAEAMRDHIQDVSDQLNAIPVPEEQAAAGPDPAMQKIIEDAEEFNRALDQQSVTMGMSSDEARIFGYEQQGVAAHLIESMRASLAYQKAEQERIDLQQSVDQFTNKLMDQVALLELAKNTTEMSADETELWKLQTQGASEAALDMAKSLIAQKKALEDSRKQADRGKELEKQYQTPVEQYRKTLEELDSLLANHHIKPETYDRALADAEKKLDNFNKKAKEKAKEVDAAVMGTADATRRIFGYMALGVTPTRSSNRQAASPVSKPLVGYDLNTKHGQDVAASLKRLVELEEAKAGKDLITVGVSDLS